MARFNQASGKPTKLHTRPRVQTDGVTPISEYDSRLMAAAGDSEQAALISEFEASKYFMAVSFTFWKNHLRAK